MFDDRTSFWAISALVWLGSAPLACGFAEGSQERTAPEAAPPAGDDNASASPPPAGAGPGARPFGIIWVTTPGEVRSFAIAEEIDLAGLFPEEQHLVGIAVDPRPPHTRYALEATTGLYALEDGEARLVFDLQAATALRGSETMSTPVELTDVAIDPSTAASDGAPGFVATAENDGFSFGLHNTLLQSYFCYFPETRGGPPAAELENPSVSEELRAQGIPVKERTEAVAINDVTGQVFAQPLTIRVDSGSVAGSELFVFEQTGGQPVATLRFRDPTFSAGGMVVAGGERLVLGYLDGIYASDGWGDPLRRIAAIELPEPVTITGMALDPSLGLFVLDGPGRRLLRIERAELDGALGGDVGL